jgi:hypothetical protein
MDNFNVTEVTRMGLILAHLLAFAAAFAAVALGDFAIFARRRINSSLLAGSSKAVATTLVALWVTGLCVIWLDTGFDIDVLLTKPKLLAKITIVSLLTLNGIGLHWLALPALGKKHADTERAALVPALLGAISGATWLFAAFVGVGKAVAPMLGYSGFMVLYGLAVLAAVTVSLTVVRPRLARRMRTTGADHFFNTAPSELTAEFTPHSGTVATASS